MGWKDRKYFVEAQSHIETQNWELAENPLTSLINESPEHAEALLHRAYIRMRKADLPRALEDIQKAAQLRPENGVMKMLEGEIQLGLQNKEGALVALQQAVKLEPDNGRALYYLGVSYRSLGKLEEAADAFERALQFDKDFAFSRWMASSG